MVTPLYGLAMAMAEGDLSGLVVGLLCLIIPFVVAYIILARTFIRTVTTRRGSAKKRYVKKEAKVASPFAAFVRREWQRFFSSSLIIMNCGLGCIMTLIVAGAIFIKGGQIRDMLSQVPEMDDAVDKFLNQRLKGREPDQKELKRTIDALLRRGHSWSDIRAGLRRYSSSLETDLEDSYE